jgi:hypothetical protein
MIDNNKATTPKDKAAVRLAKRAITLLGDGRFDEALFAADRAIAVEPDYSRAHVRLPRIGGHLC